MIHAGPHRWALIFPFLVGLFLIWFAIQSGPFYPRHHLPTDSPTSAWKVRIILIPLGVFLAAFSVIGWLRR